MACRLDQWVGPLRDALRTSPSFVRLTGLFGSSRPLVLSSLIDDPFPSALILASSPEGVERLFGDLAFFSNHRGLEKHRLVRFPSWDLPPYEWSSPVADLVGERLDILARLARGESLWVVTSIDAALQRLIPRNVLAGTVIEVRTGGTHDPGALAAELSVLGYEPTSLVRCPGEFSIRGGILDLYVGSAEAPVRLEFFGDTIESIRRIDPDAQTSTEKLDAVRIIPARELFLRPEDRPRVEAALHLMAAEQGLDKDVAGTEVSRLMASPPPLGIERIAPIVYGSLETLFDYLPAESAVILDDGSACRRSVASHEERVSDAFAEAKAEGGIVPAPDALYVSRGIFEHGLSGRAIVETEEAPVRAADGVSVVLETKTPGSLGIGLSHGPFTSTLAVIEGLRREGRIFVVGHGAESIGRLAKIFGDHDCPVAADAARPLDTMDPAGPSPVALLDGDLSAGVFIPALRWLFVTEEELFGKARRARASRRPYASVFLSSFENLRPGDRLVHLQHGIGLYRGLKRLEIAGHATETLVMEYADRAMLYVPLDRLYEVQKYVGGDGETPPLDRLGGSTWARAKRRAKKEIDTMMQELLDLYAARTVVPGHGFAPDGALSAEFDAGFEYEETPDQLRVIEEVKADMERDRPMDRLVCGDVGYGKTEVALRVAFKAVEDGRQVAVLVPTTLLADQHYRTFTRRFAPFPIRVEMISRFRTPAEQKAVLRDAREGRVDILIGTHRLLQKDIGLPNLGLLIVDEEQRFGVVDKERLKQLKKNVDVLTLTATPIPRTLQMALFSIRDLSVIETPPPDRLSVRTTVAEFERRLIREAILNELRRGGQIFFVHNRVQGIEKLAGLVKEIVPEARIGIAHGQMPERALEHAMLLFVRGELDILLSTAIIESGLDIPAANTIIINRADHFGLAELYQLRGRVGRSGQQAYALLLVSNLAVLTDPAKDRLRAIREFTELGSGFRIAARDLEIRGAGTLLGKKQSGQMASVGFELYVQMIEEAVREHRGEPALTEIEPVLNLGARAEIPMTYISEDDQRLAAYKRLSTVRDPDGLSRLAAELRDRYGPFPEETERLFDVLSIRLPAKTVGISRIDLDDDGAVLQLDPGHSVDPRILERMIRDGRINGRHHVRFLSEFTFRVRLDPAPWRERLDAVRNILQAFREYATSAP